MDTLSPDGAVPPPMTATQPAGFWIRWVAYVIDGLLIGVGGVLLACIGAALGALAGDAEMSAAIGWVLAVNVGGLLYMAATQASPRQASLGKRALGLTVSDVNGQRLTFGRALGREAAKYLNVLTLHLGWLLAGITGHKRALHDFVAGTVVVRPAGPLQRTWVVTAVVLLALSVPAAGVVAAIAIPGLLRARMAGNEARAIGALRAIHVAQANYHRGCGGYAISLSVLAGPPPYLAPELTEANTVVHEGYSILMTSSPDAITSDTSLGCRNTVDGYVVQAVPQRPGSTGMRFFVMDEEGVIFQSDNADFRSATPLP